MRIFNCDINKINMDIDFINGFTKWPLTNKINNNSIYYRIINIFNDNINYINVFINIDNININVEFIIYLQINQGVFICQEKHWGNAQSADRILK